MIKVGLTFASHLDCSVYMRLRAGDTRVGEVDRRSGPVLKLEETCLRLLPSLHDGSMRDRG